MNKANIFKIKITPFIDGRITEIKDANKNITIFLIEIDEEDFIINQDEYKQFEKLFTKYGK